jgi:hypothetical protein
MEPNMLKIIVSLCFTKQVGFIDKFFKMFVFIHPFKN